MMVERFSHVMHLTSRVTAELREGLDAVDVLAAAFPAGAVSGVPRIRSIEMTAGLEQLPRGPYAGCIGWLGLDKDAVHLDTGITIRSMWVRDGRLHWQAGSGIVYDSDAAREWKEVCGKSAIMRQVCSATEGAYVPAHR
jgi:anthranilate synthase component 1